MPLAPLLAPGTVIGGDFVIERPLQEGGMGAVFVALQRSTGKKRALKIMHRELAREPLFQKRFEQEARVGAAIASDHVVEVVAAGIDDAAGAPYLVMELLEGHDLRGRLEAHGPLSLDEFRTVFEQLCHAMAAAHAASVVHRDLKPENVFLARSRRAGADPFDVKVLDFGIARLAAEAATRSTRSAVGSPMWMAPEQTQPGAITPAADVWALGLVAYEALTGNTFWRSGHDAQATTAQLLREVVLDPIPLASVRAREQGVLEKLPDGFDGWFARCVARDPRARYPDAGAAWRALRAALDGQSDVGAAGALDETQDLASLPPGARTGEATPVVVSAASAPPFAPSAPPAPAEEPAARPRGETPVTAAHRTADRGEIEGPRGQGGRGVVALGAGIAIAGIAIAAALVTRRPAEPSVPPVATTTSSAPPSAAVTPTPPPSAQAVAPSASTAQVATSASAPPGAARVMGAPPASAPPAPPRASADAPAAASAAASSKPRPARTTASGFGDPTDRNGPVLWKVQGREVRLLTRLVSNDSNVTDAVVRKAVEWSSWQYLRCYERAFGAAKDMPEGVVSVGFEILDQLPRHGKLVSSTFESDVMNRCVVSTLIGQTINAAGPEGRGSAVMAFRFVPN